MKKQKILNYVLVCIFALVFLCIPTKVHAESATLRVLIADYDSAGYINISENNDYSGYYIDYLNEIATYTKWNYDFSFAHSVEEFNEAVALDEYDLYVGLKSQNKTDTNYLDYPNYPISPKNYYLATKKSNDSISSSDYTTLYGKKVAVSDSENSGLIHQFKSFCSTYDIPHNDNSEELILNGVNFIYVDKNSLYSTLANNEVDAILASDSYILEHKLRPCINFSKKFLYIATPKSSVDTNRHLILNNALYFINNSNSHFQEMLYNKYFLSENNDTLEFSEAEKKIINSGKFEYSVGIIDNFAPYSFINNENKPDGAIVKLFSEISNLTSGSVKFTYKTYDSIDDIYRAVSKGECNINAFQLQSKYIEPTSTYTCSDIYYSENFVLYTSTYSSHNKEALIGTTKNVHTFLDTISEQHTLLDSLDYTYTNYGSVLDCVVGLHNSTCDYAILMESSANYYINT